VPSRAYDGGMHLVFIFPVAVWYLATKSKTALVVLIILVLPTLIRMLFHSANHGEWGGGNSGNGNRDW
jgi:hypothetical protein